MYPARLCLRGGFVCFTEVARAMGFDLPYDPDPERGISITYQEFLDAVARLRAVDFPIERRTGRRMARFRRLAGQLRGRRLRGGGGYRRRAGAVVGTPPQDIKHHRPDPPWSQA